MKIATLCDFGNPSRREVIRIHLSQESAQKAFQTLAEIYGKDGAKVWQEPHAQPIILQNGRIAKTQAPTNTPS